MSVLWVLMALLLWVGAAQAAIDWEEGFEYANNAAMDAVWETSCPADDTILSPSTDRAHSGAKSLKMIYRGHQATGTTPATPGYKSCFKIRPLSASTEVLFTRWWLFMETTFAIDTQAGTKLTRHEKPSTYPGMWWLWKFGSSQLSVSIEGIKELDGSFGTDDFAGNIAITKGRWECIETEIRESTPGVRNGVVRQWINGNISLNKTDAAGRETSPFGPGGQNGPTSALNRIKLYVQDGVGTLYVDDYAVDRTARIGCGSAPVPPVDTQAPTAPTGLTVQ
jgi:hypothetical protein